jgi:RHS repeat-associated protein
MQTSYSYDCASYFVPLCALSVSLYTGKERDAESGLDYFGARYYASSMGRWMSPDWADKPEAVPYSDLSNPQSLNLYGYVKNNPLSQADPDGHCCEEEDSEDEVAEEQSFVDQIARAGRQGHADEFNRRELRLNPNATPLTPAQVDEAEAEGGQKLHNLLNPGGDMLDRQLAADANKEAEKRGGGGDNADTKLGREKHQEFTDKANAKGWETGKRYIDPATGKTVIPDAVTKIGHPVELKPSTPRGRARGRSQRRAQERATGKNGKVIYYDKP